MPRSAPMPRRLTLNLVAAESAAARAATTAIAARPPAELLAELDHLPLLRMPARHPLRAAADVDPKRLHQTLLRTYEQPPADFEGLLGVPGLGPRSLRALTLVAELIHGARASTRDPARFAFAHGGKDGTPFPVDRGDLRPDDRAPARRARPRQDRPLRSVSCAQAPCRLRCGRSLASRPPLGIEPGTRVGGEGHEQARPGLLSLCPPAPPKRWVRQGAVRTPADSLPSRLSGAAGDDPLRTDHGGEGRWRSRPCGRRSRAAAPSGLGSRTSLRRAATTSSSASSSSAGSSSSRCPAPTASSCACGSTRGRGIPRCSPSSWRAARPCCSSCSRPGWSSSGPGR